MPEEDSFTVSIMFSAAARQHLGLQPGPAKQCQLGPDQSNLRYVQAGDFLRMQGFAGLYRVSHRVWHLMPDQTELKLVLEGPVE